MQSSSCLAQRKVCLTFCKVMLCSTHPKTKIQLSKNILTFQNRGVCPSVFLLFKSCSMLLPKLVVFVSTGQVCKRIFSFQIEWGILLFVRPLNQYWILTHGTSSQQKTPYGMSKQMKGLKTNLKCFGGGKNTFLITLFEYEV